MAPSIRAGPTGRERVVGLVIIVEGQADLLEVVDALAAASGLRAAWTAGRSRAIRTAMIAITTSSSISVKPRRVRDCMHVPPIREGMTGQNEGVYNRTSQENFARGVYKLCGESLRFDALVAISLDGNGINMNGTHFSMRFTFHKASKIFVSQRKHLLNEHWNGEMFQKNNISHDRASANEAMGMATSPEIEYPAEDW